VAFGLIACGCGGAPAAGNGAAIAFVRSASSSKICVASSGLSFSSSKICVGGALGTFTGSEPMAASADRPGGGGGMREGDGGGWLGPERSVGAGGTVDPPVGAEMPSSVRFAIGGGGGVLRPDGGRAVALFFPRPSNISRSDPLFSF
jgi:hypothetical protein